MSRAIICKYLLLNCFSFGKKIVSAILCGMDESKTVPVKHGEQTISYIVPAKKIVTFKVKLM